MTKTIRKQPPLLESEVDPNPVVMLQEWIRVAGEADFVEPEAMILATAGADGMPSARVVLMKSLDETGLVFYTNRESRKGKELEENPRASVVFYWDVLLRQVRVSGSVSVLSTAESFEYFKTRPLESQIGAWASRQSSVLPDRASLEKEVRRVEQEFKGKEIPLPPFWGGYCLVPREFEFWQAREGRLHDRIRYSRNGEKWLIERLSP